MCGTGLSARQREREGGLLPLALAGCGARPTSAQGGCGAGCGAAGLGQLGSAQDEGEGGLLHVRWAEGKMAKRAREEETAFRPETGKEGVFFLFLFLF